MTEFALANQYQIEMEPNPFSDDNGKSKFVTFTYADGKWLSRQVTICQQEGTTWGIYQLVLNINHVTNDCYVEDVFLSFVSGTQWIPEQVLFVPKFVDEPAKYRMPSEIEVGMNKIHVEAVDYDRSVKYWDQGLYISLDDAQKLIDRINELESRFLNQD